MHVFGCAFASQVARVHVGGSFGRKTSVKGRFDVDMLVLLNGFDPKDGRTAAKLLQRASAPAPAGRKWECMLPAAVCMWPSLMPARAMMPGGGLWDGKGRGGGA